MGGGVGRNGKKPETRRCVPFLPAPPHHSNQLEVGQLPLRRLGLLPSPGERRKRTERLRPKPRRFFSKGGCPPSTYGSFSAGTPKASIAFLLTRPTASSAAPLATFSADPAGAAAGGCVSGRSERQPQKSQAWHPKEMRPARQQSRRPLPPLLDPLNTPHLWVAPRAWRPTSARPSSRPPAEAQ